MRGLRPLRHCGRKRHDRQEGRTLPKKPAETREPVRHDLTGHDLTGHADGAPAGIGEARMTGSSSLPRYQPHPDHLHWELRAFFCYFLVREQAYSDVTSTLDPLWKDVLGRHPNIDPRTPFTQIPALPDTNDPVNIYLSTLRSEVSDHLRCREQGAPAAWVCHAIHAG